MKLELELNFGYFNKLTICLIIMTRKIGIIIIGNEILSGRTIDTNSNWLANKLYHRGYEINRVVIIPDEIKGISDCIHEFIYQCEFDMVFICGGLGPTQDDKTSQGIAEGLNLKLSLNKKALEFIKKRYQEAWRDGKISNPEITQGRRKMAYLPESSIILTNEIGFGPGYYIKQNVNNRKIIIFSLPGVPKEMKNIFEKSIEGILIGNNIEKKIVKEIKVSISESLLFEIFSKIEKKFPKIKIESHPDIENNSVQIRIIGSDELEINKVIQDITSFVSKHSL